MLLLIINVVVKQIFTHTSYAWLCCSSLKYNTILILAVYIYYTYVDSYLYTFNVLFLFAICNLKLGMCIRFKILYVCICKYKQHSLKKFLLYVRMCIFRFTGIIFNILIRLQVCVYLLVTRFKNSSLVLGSSRKTPNIVEVTVLLLIFCTPRITMHM